MPLIKNPRPSPTIKHPPHPEPVMTGRQRRKMSQAVMTARRNLPGSAPPSSRRASMPPTNQLADVVTKARASTEVDLMKGRSSLPEIASLDLKDRRRKGSISHIETDHKEPVMTGRQRRKMSQAVMTARRNLPGSAPPSSRRASMPPTNQLADVVTKARASTPDNLFLIFELPVDCHSNPHLPSRGEMHKNYQPVKPATNKLLKKRWDGAAHDMHRKKVANAKPVVDTGSPHTYAHLQSKLKKLQLDEERHAVIDRDNRHLLERMSEIMRTRGRVDNWNGYEPKSLNKAKRTRELIRVTLENQKILARIQAKQPQYSVKKWEDEWVDTKKYMGSIRRYSDDWYQQMQEEKRRSRQSSRGSRKAIAILHVVCAIENTPYIPSTNRPNHGDLNNKF
eukprot:sb/3465458/